MSLNTEHLGLLGAPGRLRLWNMTPLEDNGFLVASRLILLNSLALDPSFLDDYNTTFIGA